MFLRSCTAVAARASRSAMRVSRNLASNSTPRNGSGLSTPALLAAGALCCSGAWYFSQQDHLENIASAITSDSLTEVSFAAGTAISRWPNTTVLQSPAITLLFTSIRNIDTPVATYINDADRLMRILAEEGLARVRGVKSKRVQTPCGFYDGLEAVDESKMCAVSIVRSGDILLEAVRGCAPNIKVGKILCQRDESHPDKIAKLYYSKFPKDIASLDIVILVDPMLATGGSAMLAIETLLKAGVKEANIMFLNVVSCPEGLDALATHYPNIQIVTAAVDSHLNEDKYIVPGLGDFGDRYYST